MASREMNQPTTEQSEFWDKVLRDHRLGMGRGSSNLVYAGGTENLQDIEEETIRLATLGKRKKKRGKGPDS